MTTLKELLDNLEINTDDIDPDEKKEEELDLSKVKLEDIPEAQRPIFKKLFDTTEQLRNDVATRDLAIKTIKQAFPKQEKVEKKPEKVLGVLDPEDPYAPAFSKLEQMISGISKKDEQNEEEKFKSNLTRFASEHKDIVRYANKMDEIIAENPTLIRNIPRLYTLAKAEVEGGGREKEQELEHQGKVRKFQTERSGIDSSRVKEQSNAKNITEAFGQAEKQLQTRR